jgi:hypothetical protein
MTRPGASGAPTEVGASPLEAVEDQVEAVLELGPEVVGRSDGAAPPPPVGG